MIVTCWSVKGGSGTTVVAASLALRFARTAPPVVLVDMAGDIAAALGRPEPAGPGVTDWLAAGPEVAADALERLVIPVTAGLALVPAGSHPPSAVNAADGERLVDALGRLDAHTVVVDAGSTGDDLAIAVAGASTRSLLVVRPCFLALRRAIAAAIRPSAVLLVSESHRTLGPADVEDVLGTPVLCVPWDPGVARAVDAGLLASRVPRPLDRALRHAA